MLIKEIKLLFEETTFEVEYNTNSCIATVRLTEYAVNEEKSSPDYKHYDEKSKIEVYLLVDEVKEIVKALKEAISEEDWNE